MVVALKLNYVDVINDGSLANTYVDGKKMGYKFSVRLSYYRGQFLSVLENFSVTVDGQRVPNDTIKFCLNGKEFSPWQLAESYSEYWLIMQSATINVQRVGGLAAGRHHIEFNLLIRVPYMPIGDNHQYMHYDSSGEKTLAVVG